VAAGKRFSLPEVIQALGAQYGKPAKPVPKTPFEWVMWKNVAYLVDVGRVCRLPHVSFLDLYLTSRKELVHELCSGIVPGTLHLQ